MVDAGIVIGKAIGSQRVQHATDVLYILSPATFLTKICMVDSASAEDAREDAEEIELMLPERAMIVEVDEMGGED